MSLDFDPMKHRPLRPRGHRDAEELPENRAFTGAPVTFPVHTQQLEELRKLTATLQKAKEVAQYIVWNPDSNLPPRVIHQDRPTAIKVAGRMAHENPGKEFFVCKLVNSAKKPLPVEVDYKDLDR